MTLGLAGGGVGGWLGAADSGDEAASGGGLMAAAPAEEEAVGARLEVDGRETLCRGDGGGRRGLVRR